MTLPAEETTAPAAAAGAEAIAAPAAAAEPPASVAAAGATPAEAVDVGGGEDAATAAPPTVLAVRIEPAGPSAERGVAALAAGSGMQRDHLAELGSPAAIGHVHGGESALQLLVRAAELSLDDTDLHITLHRS